MKRDAYRWLAAVAAGAAVMLLAGTTFGLSEAFKGNIFDPGTMKPVDSVLKVRVGDLAPDFTLPSVGGARVSLGQFRGGEKRRALVCSGGLDTGLLGPVARL